MYLVLYVCAGVCVVGLVMCLVVYTRLRLTNTFLCSYSCVPADQECCHGILTSATAGKALFILLSHQCFGDNYLTHSLTQLPLLHVHVHVLYACSMYVETNDYTGYWR